MGRVFDQIAMQITQMTGSLEQIPLWCGQECPRAGVGVLIPEQRRRVAGQGEQDLMQHVVDGGSLPWRVERPTYPKAERKASTGSDVETRYETRRDLFNFTVAGWWWSDSLTRASSSFLRACH